MERSTSRQKNVISVKKLKLTIYWFFGCFFHMNVSTRIKIKSGQGIGTEWYHVTDEDDDKMFFPTLRFHNEKAFKIKSKFSPNQDEFYYWLNYPHNLEFRQQIQVTIYCSFDFSTYPFDSHECNFSFGLNFWSISYIKMKPPTIIHEKEETNLGQKELQGV